MIHRKRCGGQCEDAYNNYNVRSMGSALDGGILKCQVGSASETGQVRELSNWAVAVVGTSRMHRLECKRHDRDDCIISNILTSSVKQGWITCMCRFTTAMPMSAALHFHKVSVVGVCVWCGVVLCGVWVCVCVCVCVHSQITAVGILMTSTLLLTCVAQGTAMGKLKHCRSLKRFGSLHITMQTLSHLFVAHAVLMPVSPNWIIQVATRAL